MSNSDTSFLNEAFAGTQKGVAAGGIPLGSFFVCAGTARSGPWIEGIGE